MFGQGDPQELFKSLLVTVVEGAYGAAGYGLEPRPMQWAGGLFRYARRLDAGQYAGMHAFIEYQHLHYADGAKPNTFRVDLIRHSHANPMTKIAHPHNARRSLSALVVVDFGVAILPSPDHWWTYRDVSGLGRALGEAGHLVIGYGLGWLDGSLAP